MLKKRFAEIAVSIFVIYFLIGFILSFYFDYELISEYGFWNWFWYGRDEHSAFYEIIFWPFYI